MSIKVYGNSDDFINDNREYFLKNKIYSSFFEFDKIDKTDKKNYIIKAYFKDKMTVIYRKYPYNAYLFGNKRLVKELFSYIINEGYDVENISSIIKINNIAKKNRYNNDATYVMSTNKINKYNKNSVVSLDDNDIDKLMDNLKEFLIETNGPDIVYKIAPKDRVKKSINSYKAIKINDEIISMAKISKIDDNRFLISDVYTKLEYRNKGYAKSVIGYLTEEILNKGMIPILKVDKRNKIAFYLYKSIGYKKSFIVGEYSKKD